MPGVICVRQTPVLPAARSTGSGHATRAAIKREIAARPEPRVNDASLRLWGRLRDFDTKGITKIDPSMLLGMTR